MTIVMQCLSARENQLFFDNILLSVIWNFKNYSFSERFKTNIIEISKGKLFVIQLILQFGRANLFSFFTLFWGYFQFAVAIEGD